jgi:hypothetical protein
MLRGNGNPTPGWGKARRVVARAAERGPGDSLHGPPRDLGARRARLAPGAPRCTPAPRAAPPRRNSHPRPPYTAPLPHPCAARRAAVR